jgi:hypothetical protein
MFVSPFSVLQGVTRHFSSQVTGSVPQTVMMPAVTNVPRTVTTPHPVSVRVPRTVSTFFSIFPCKMDGGFFFGPRPVYGLICASFVLSQLTREVYCLSF